MLKGVSIGAWFSFCQSLFASMYS